MNKNSTLFSIIMPAYNASKYILEAINSVINQKYTNWELIIVDDGSTDNTNELIEDNFKDDKRIQLIKQEHMGTAGAARNTALNYVKGEYIQILDSDDYLSDDLLEEYNELLCKCDTKPSIIVPLAYMIDDYANINKIWSNPTKQSFVNGNKAFELSINWNIHGWVCLKTELVRKVKWENNSLNGDEFTTRKFFYNSDSVYFTNGIYYYRLNNSSTTRNPKNETRMYDTLVTAYNLYLFSKENNCSRKCKRFCANNFVSIEAGLSLKYINQNKVYSNEDRERLYSLLENYFNNVSFTMKFYTKYLPFYLFSFGNFKLFLLLLRICRRVMYDVRKLFIKNKEIEEIIRNEKKIKKELHRKYNGKSKIKTNAKTAIMMFDGNISSGGLCDRLRGIISIYQTCKELGIDLKIYFVHPFSLKDYMEPNMHDWIINNNEIIYNNKSKPIFIYSTKGDEEEGRKQKQLVTKMLKKNYTQFHFYTNAHYSLFSDTYSRDFNELFKPTEIVCQNLEKYLLKDSKYVSVSYRFIQLLGDFDEKYKSIYPVLPEEQRENLINKGIEVIYKIYEKEQKKVFVATDSVTFLKRVESIPFVFVIPGTIVHVDATSDAGMEAHMKTFVDFYMIANAEKVYLAHTTNMHYSGFPKNAALLSEKPFETVEF